MSIYTRTGDNGTTSLFGGKRVLKSNPIIVACGSIDELSAVIGVVLSYELSKSHKTLLKEVQKNLYEIMAVLSSAKKEHLQEKLKEVVKRMEKEMDKIMATLPPLSHFILPGGSRISVFLHVARTVCRRAERSVIVCEPTNPMITPYINRLSDLFFVLARKYNNQEKTI